MEEIRLDVQLRNEVGSRRIKKVRRQNFVPAVVYGEEERSAVVKVDRRTYERITRQHKGQNVIFHLYVVDGDKTLGDYSVIVKEEQHDPVSDRLQHIDFNRISLTKAIEVKVPLLTKGEAVGVKRDGGSLDHVLWELDVICLPTQIPEGIEIEVGPLEIGDSIHVKDITLPPGVRTKHDPEAILVSVVPPMKEEPVGVPEEAAVQEPEVLKEKKKEEATAEEGKAEKAPKKEEKAEGKAKEGK